MELLTVLASAAAEGAEKAGETAHDATLFYVVGTVLAVVTVLASLVGLKKDGFPGSDGAGWAMILVSTALAAGAMASAVIVAT